VEESIRIQFGEGGKNSGDEDTREVKNIRNRYNSNSKRVILFIRISIKKKDIGKIFKNIHTYFVLETQPQGWRVERRYKDLLKLRSCLTKAFSGYIVNI